MGKIRAGQGEAESAVSKSRLCSTPEVKEPTIQVPHFGEALLGEGLRESWVALELQVGQSSQTIQGQSDQLVVSQVPGDGRAERDTTVRAVLPVRELPQLTPW